MLPSKMKDNSMGKRLSLSLSVEVPTDPFAAAAVYTKMQPTWTALLEAIKATGVPCDTHITEAEVREKRTRGRPRKPRLVQPTPDAA